MDCRLWPDVRLRHPSWQPVQSVGQSPPARRSGQSPEQSPQFLMDFRLWTDVRYLRRPARPSVERYSQARQPVPPVGQYPPARQLVQSLRRSPRRPLNPIVTMNFILIGVIY